MTPRRYVAGWSLTRRVFAAAVWLGVAASWRPTAAQVGYPPGRSPFHDIQRGGWGVLAAGYLGGERGSVGVGPSNGPSVSVRYERVLGGPAGISLGLAYAQATRFVVNPYKDSLTRTSGPFDNHVVLADVGLQILLTGAKTWHGVAPYIGSTFGLAFGGASPPDTSGYRFGTKFTLAPGGGVHWYPARRLSVRADVRALFWRLRYPQAYKQPSPADSSRVLPVNASETEWTTHPWITIGIGWNF